MELRFLISVLTPNFSVPVSYTHLDVYKRQGMLFITLPSGRNLAYVKPKVSTNKFGGECITYEGVGTTKKWERLDSYGPKFVENIVQTTSRNILCYAMKTLRCCSIVMYIHDELVNEADPRMFLDALCEPVSYTHLDVYKRQVQILYNLVVVRHFATKV